MKEDASTPGIILTVIAVVAAASNDAVAVFLLPLRACSVQIRIAWCLLIQVAYTLAERNALDNCADRE